MASRGAKTIPRELPLARTDCVRNHPCGGAIGNWHTHVPKGGEHIAGFYDTNGQICVDLIPSLLRSIRALYT